MLKIFNKIVIRIRFIIYHKRYKEFHTSNRVDKPTFITPHCIEMKPYAHIRGNCRIEGVEYYQGEKFKPLITIGQGVGIEQNAHITCANRIIIGSHTSIAANVTITDIDHPYEDINSPIELQKIRVNEVVIGEDCKLYNGVVILPGVHLGKHVCVGANSVVNKNIPDYCVVVGCPARIVKRYNPNTEQWEKTDKDGNFIA